MNTNSRPQSTLRHQVILITGAGGGIGGAAAAGLAARGATVVLADVDLDGLERTAAAVGGGPLSARLDVTDLAACHQLVRDIIERHGRLDAVWANAGISAYGPLDLMDPAIWTRVVEVNLIGAHNTVRAALPSVIAARGYVALTCSLASFTHQPGHSAYAASKAGLEAMANSLRTELAGTGVDVGTFHPGWIATQMVTEKDDHQLAFQRFRNALKPPFNGSTPIQDIVGPIVRAFDSRSQRMVYPRSGWLAHATRALLNTPLLTRPMRAAAPEIRALFIEQQAREGAGAAISERYRRHIPNDRDADQPTLTLVAVPQG